MAQSLAQTQWAFRSAARGLFASAATRSSNLSLHCFSFCFQGPSSPKRTVPTSCQPPSLRLRPHHPLEVQPVHFELESRSTDWSIHQREPNGCRAASSVAGSAGRVDFQEEGELKGYLERIAECNKGRVRLKLDAPCGGNSSNSYSISCSSACNWSIVRQWMFIGYTKS